MKTADVLETARAAVATPNPEVTFTLSGCNVWFWRQQT
jgi:hypothetical protein